MIDPILALAHSVQSNRGVFAVLLGSGVSRSAGIPTGWEVTLDLVKRVAAMEGVEPTPDPEAWFAAKHGKGPEYSALLDALAKTAAERRAILHSLFEPTPEEQDDGLKLPTKAHRAIARLVAKGYVKVVVTTNFDRLMELALQDEGVVPTVISTADGTKGAAPLVHQRCVVVKVHGDYLDDRIKNTEGELSAYEPELDQYLDRILDEFGLIISGWSGEWDPALRAAIERCPNRRYTTFWTSRGTPSAKAERLMTHRGAQLLEVASADEFFEDLADKIESLEELSAPSPLSVAAAVATVKRYASDPVHRIKFHDLLINEAKAVNAKSMALPVGPVSVDDDYLRGRFAAFDSMTVVLRALLYEAAFWAEPFHYDAIKRAIAATVWAERVSGSSVLLQMRIYPTIIGFYAAALGAADGGKFALLNELTRMTVGYGREAKSALSDFAAFGSLNHNIAMRIETTQWYFPLSEHFRRELFPSPAAVRDFDSPNKFDRLEVLLALAYLDHRQTPEDIPGWMPFGRYAAMHHDTAYEPIFEEAAREKEAWGPLRGGMFGGKVARVEEIKATFTAILREEGRRWR